VSAPVVFSASLLQEASKLIDASKRIVRNIFICLGLI
jgi:hypothetical protein